MLELASLGIDSYAQSHPTSMAPQGIVCWDQFVSDVFATRSSLDDSGNSRWALFEEDSYRMAVGLFALWSIGAKVYLPGDNHHAVVEALRAQNAQFLGVFPSVQDGYEIVTSKSVESGYELQLSGELVVFTSGSSGKPKLIVKQIHQLDAELCALESIWGKLLGHSLVMGTVSHQHLYGLLFSVLWPLCSGRAFWYRPFFDTLSMCRETASLPETAWIMSPAHLHRLSHEIPWDDVKSSLSVIYSSGGPLDFDAAQSTYQASGKLPIEVLGSSETGGIAWRQQAIEGQDWKTLPGVEVRCTDEGALAVRSPFLPDREWYETADGANVESSSSFKLGKRLDRIVKIEGKRISLPEVEESLVAHDWIDEIVAIPLTRRRLSVAVAMVLSTLGDKELAVLGRREFLRKLRVDISSRLPSVSVPRFWRIVEELPRNSQGKLRYGDVREMFKPDRMPAILSRVVSASSCDLCLRVPITSQFFEGHFSFSPVLPGVVQIFWAEHYGRELLGVSGLFRSMRTVKFKEIIRPGDKVQLTLDYASLDGILQFHYRSSSGEHSQGRLCFGEQI